MVPGLASGPTADPVAKLSHSLSSGGANSPASVAGGRTDIPAGCRPVADRLRAGLAGTNDGRFGMVSSGSVAS